MAQITGRCIALSGHTPLYSDCGSIQEEDRCWHIRRSAVPHDQQMVFSERQTTLSFDDSGLTPHGSVIAPARSKSDLFMQMGTVTDIGFDVSFDANEAVSVPITPVRLYNGTDRPVVTLRCFGLFNQVRLPCKSQCSGFANQSTKLCTPEGLPGEQAV